MTKKQMESEAVLTVGSGLSKTTKMPCSSFNLSALDCITGSKLVKIEGTVCFGCYALDGNYRRFNWINKMRPKTEKIMNDGWVDSMVWLINNTNKGDKEYFLSLIHI